MKLTAVITTRNEAANIANCIHAFDAFRDQVEIVVVDNQSTDDTKKIAAELGATVLDKGPERSAQRNLGWQTATSDWVVVLDADMILPDALIREILAIALESDNRTIGQSNNFAGISPICWSFAISSRRNIRTTTFPRRMLSRP